MMTQTSENDANKKLVAMVGDTAISKSISEEEHEHQKYEVYEAIDKLVSAGRELYCNGDLSWDELVQDLAKSITKLKGKEDDLKALGEEDDTENEQESMDED